MKIDFILPSEIEKRSFEIISEELSKMGISIPEEQEPITKRVIHTSADFDYASTMTYSDGAIARAKELIKNSSFAATTFTNPTGTPITNSGVNFPDSIIS